MGLDRELGSLQVVGVPVDDVVLPACVPDRLFTRIPDLRWHGAYYHERTVAVENLSH